jgi:rare lipoprotein A
MPTARNDQSRAASSVMRRWFAPDFLQLSLFFSLGALLACTSCKRPSTQVEEKTSENQTPPALAEAQSPSPTPKPRQLRPIEGFASWYDVPANSLTRKRAGKDELTAAHNRLPFGTLVRVTHLANGRSVIVRITDRLVTRGRTVIDLCKEAAEQLAMVSEGHARVRMEILPDDNRIDAVPDSTANAAHP